MEQDTWRLPASLRVQDVTRELQRLRGAFDSRRPIVIDISPLESVDTAGVQLVHALLLEGRRQDIPVQLHGESAALAGALRLLGFPS